MFLVTEQWLKDNYGSSGIAQEVQAGQWLDQYGVDITPEKSEKWRPWKHLVEYQVNTHDIVPKALDMIGRVFPSELQVHKMINLMRVPLAVVYDVPLIYTQPRTILELGVGGDSAISTAVFLSFLEVMGGGLLYSIDHNSLGKTWDRYKKYSESGMWFFKQADSIETLTEFARVHQKFDLVFIDTSHSYAPTLQEMMLATQITNNILMDDATFEGNESDEIRGGRGGVKRAIQEFMEIKHDEWRWFDLWHGSVGFFTTDKNIKIPYTKNIENERVL